MALLLQQIQLAIFSDATGKNITDSSITISASNLLQLPLGNDGYQNQFVRVVAPSGSGNYTSISAALNNIGSAISVVVRPGNYYEQPFTVPTGVRITAPSRGTNVFATNNSVDFISLQDDVFFESINVYGPTNAIAVKTISNNTASLSTIRLSRIYGSQLAICASGSLNLNVEDSKIVSCVTGVCVPFGTSASLTNVDITSCTAYGITNAGYTKLANIRIFDLYRQTNTSSIGLYSQSGSHTDFVNLIVQDVYTGIYTVPNVPRSIDGSIYEYENCQEPLVANNGTGSLNIFNILGELTNIRRGIASQLNLIGYDTKPNEEAYYVTTDIKVGTYIDGRHMEFGQTGRTSNLLCFTSSSTGQWTDYSRLATNLADSGTFSFPGTGSNNSIYFAINAVKVNGLYQRPYSLNFILNNTAAYGTGSYIEWETWNGSAWTHLHSMATQHNSGYYDLNTGSFDRYTQQTIRFNQNTLSNAATTSLPGLSFSSSSQIWIRARITGALLDIP